MQKKDIHKNINRDITSQILEITQIFIRIRTDKSWRIHIREHYRKMR